MKRTEVKILMTMSFYNGYVRRNIMDTEIRLLLTNAHVHWSAFLQSSELGLPPTPQSQVAGERPPPPPPFGSGGRGTLAGERGVGRVPISTRGHTYI